jgi:hypothetical protein
VAFQNELVMSGEAAGRKIEGSKSWNLRSEALFEIGQLNVAALDPHDPMRRRSNDPDLRQRPGCAVGLNIHVNAYTGGFPWQRLNIALNFIVLRNSRQANHAQYCRHGKTMRR